MYSYEDRIRAVKLYIKLGKHTGATIRQLGYPTKNSLKSWYEEYERCLDLSRGYALSKPKYSLAQREKAVGYYLDHGRCIASTIKALGYPARDSLRAWIHELHPELHTRVVGRSDGLARPPAMKQAAVIALCTRQESANALAQKLGVCRPTLYNWKNQLLGPEASASIKRRQETPSSPEREELERQLESFRLDVRRLPLEHDLLMKASCSGSITSVAGPDYIARFGTTLAENIGPLRPTISENETTLPENSPITSASAHIS